MIILLYLYVTRLKEPHVRNRNRHPFRDVSRDVDYVYDTRERYKLI